MKKTILIFLFIGMSYFLPGTITLAQAQVPDAALPDLAEIQRIMRAIGEGVPSGQGGTLSRRITEILENAVRRLAPGSAESADDVIREVIERLGRLGVHPEQTSRLVNALRNLMRMGGTAVRAALGVISRLGTTLASPLKGLAFVGGRLVLIGASAPVQAGLFVLTNPLTANDYLEFIQRYRVSDVINVVTRADGAGDDKRWRCYAVLRYVPDGSWWKYGTDDEDEWTKGPRYYKGIPRIGTVTSLTYVLEIDCDLAENWQAPDKTQAIMELAESTIYRRIEEFEE